MASPDYVGWRAGFSLTGIAEQGAERGGKPPTLAWDRTLYGGKNDHADLQRRPGQVGRRPAPRSYRRRPISVFGADHRGLLPPVLRLASQAARERRLLSHGGGGRAGRVP